MKEKENEMSEVYFLITILEISEKLQVSCGKIEEALVIISRPNLGVGRSTPLTPALSRKWNVGLI